MTDLTETTKPILLTLGRRCNHPITYLYPVSKQQALRYIKLGAKHIINEFPDHIELDVLFISDIEQ